MRPLPVGFAQIKSTITAALAALCLALANIAAAQAPLCSSSTLDSDGDGIPDVADNCILVANADQRDTGGTGIGNACNPDLNHDGVVNSVDVALFRTALLAFNSAAHTYNPDADFNGDGQIDSADLAILQKYMYSAPGPSANTPALRATPSQTLNFGTSFVGVQSIQGVQLQNAGCKSVSITSAALSGDPAFQVFPPTQITLLSPGQTATLQLGFRPTTTAAVNGVLTLQTNGQGAAISIALLGRGVAPAAGQTPALVAPAGITFQALSSGATATRALSLANAGSAPLVVASMTPSNSAYAVDPSLLGGFPLTLAPGASASLPMTLTASATTGPLNATLQIASNDPKRPTAAVGLTGSVTASAAQSVSNNPVTSAQVFDGQTPITAANCSAVTRAVSFGAGVSAGDQFEAVLTDAVGQTVASAPFAAPAASGTQMLSGINACGLADGVIDVSVLYMPSSGRTLSPFVGTPATKDTSALAAPTLTPPSVPYYTSTTANICGTSRANTTVVIDGGSSSVSTTLTSATTFCLNVPLKPNQQNTLIATAVDNLAAPPRPKAVSTPLLVTQINPSQVVIAQATSTPLNATQIATLVQNGVINVQDPNNFNVSIFTIVLTVGSFPVTVTQPVVTPVASGAAQITATNGWSRPDTSQDVPDMEKDGPGACEDFCSTVVAIQPPVGPVIPGVIIIDGRIKTLKEFFQVTLAVQNTSSQFSLTDVASSLSLPAGELTPVSAGLGTDVGSLTTANPSSNISLGSIAPGATGTGQYIIRGDAIGTYSLAVQYNGFITGGGLPAGIPFTGSAGTTVQVFGPPQLGVVVHHPRPTGSNFDVVAGQVFPLTVDITNNSATPALYSSLDLFVGGAEQLVDAQGNPLVDAQGHPKQDEVVSFGNIDPGATVSASFLAKASVQGYVIACQGITSANIQLSVDLGSGPDAACNIANTIPAAFTPPPPDSPPTVLGISPTNGQGGQPVTTSVVAELTPVSSCVTADRFTNVVTAPIDPNNLPAGTQVISADLASGGTFYVEELDAAGNTVRRVPVDLTVVSPPAGGTTIAALRLGLASPLSQYFLKSLTNYRVTLVGADRSSSPGGAICNALNQAPLAQTYSWTFSTAQACTNDPNPTAALGEPADGSSSQSVTTPIVVNFSSGIDPATVQVNPTNPLADSFAVFAAPTLSGGDISGGSLVAGSAQFTNLGKTLTFTPAGALPFSTPVYVRLTSALQDKCGTTLNAGTNGVQLFNFQTAAKPSSAPTAPRVNPVPGVTDLSSIPVTGTAPGGTTVTVTGGALAAQATTSSSGNFSVQVTLNLNQTNSLSVKATDSAGNVSPAATSDINGKPLSVQSDQAPLSVTGVTPGNGAQGISAQSNIAISFNKAISPSTANVLNVQLSAGSQSVAGSLSAGSTQITFTPGASLSFGTTYQVHVRANGVSDLAGNTLASDFSSSFTTAAGPLTLTQLSPTSAAPGANLTVTFTGTNLAAATAVVSGNPNITGTITGVSPTSVTAAVTIAATAATGSTTLGLAVGGQTVFLPFNVTAGAPTITTLTPASGEQGRTLTVQIAGTNLGNISAINVSGIGVTATASGGGTVTSQTAIFVIASDATLGARTVTVTTAGGSAAATFTVNQPAPLSVSLSPAPITLSTSSSTTVTLTLNEPAPTGGQVINLTATAGLVTFSANPVTIPASQTSATVTVQSSTATGSDTVTASGTGITSGTAQVQVQARTFTLSLGVVSLSRTTQGTITLAQPAPAGGATFKLSIAASALASVSPTSVNITAGQSTATFQVTAGATPGSTTLAADGTATGFGTQTVPLTVSNVQLNLSPATQSLALGQTGSLQVQIAPNPAPAGGLQINLVSSNSNVAQVAAQTVTIPAGAFTASFNVEAGTSSAGTTTITASNPAVGSTTAQVTISAGIQIAESSKTLASTQTDIVDFQLLSGGSPFVAPAGGVSVSASTSDNTCVNVTAASVIVAPGRSFGAAPIAYAGTAPLPCTATVTVSNSLFGSASIPVTYQAAATIGSMTLSNAPSGVGAGLETSLTLSLSTGSHGGVTVQIRSSNSTLLLVAPNATTAGAPALNLSIPNGTSSATFYLQGISGASGSVTLTATSPKFTNGTGTVQVVAADVGFSNAPPASTTTLTGDSAFSVGTYIPLATGGFQAQAVSAAAGPLPVTVLSSVPTVGQLKTGTTTGPSITLQIPAGVTASGNGASSSGGDFVPAGSGTTTLTVMAPAFTSAPAAGFGTQTVTVTQPTMTLSVGNAASIGVGVGLELNSGLVALSASQHGGVTIHITSSDPTRVLLSLSGTAAGTAAIDIPIQNGATSAGFWLQGVAPGTASVSATDPADNKFAAAAAASANVVQADVGFFNTPPTSTTTLSGDSLFGVGTFVPFGNGGYLSEPVSAAANAVNVTVTSGTPSVGQVKAGTTTGPAITVQIPKGASSSGNGAASGGGDFVPLGSGTTTLTVSAPGLVTAPTAGFGTQTVTVTQPVMTLSLGNATSIGVGAGLELNSGNISLGAAQHGGVTIHITSSDPTKVLLSLSGTAAGAASIDIPIANGNTSASFWLQGVGIGSAGITASDPQDNKFSTTAALTASVVQAVVGLFNDPPTSTTTLTGDSAFSVGTYVPFGNGGYLSEAVSPAGSAVTITVASSATGVGQLKAGTTTGASVTLQIPTGASSSGNGATRGGGDFVPTGSGTTTLTVTAPGFGSAPTSGFGTETITVTQPTMTLNLGNANSIGIGAGLELNGGTLSLGAAQHGGVTIHVTSSDPTRVLLSLSGTAAGAAAIDIPIANGNTSAGFWLQGIAAGSASITASDPADNKFGTPTAVSANVVQADVGFFNTPPTSTTTLSGDSLFSVGTFVPFGNGGYLSEPVSPANGALTVMVSSSAASVGQIKAGTTTGASATMLIAPGASSSPNGAAAGGGDFVPAGAGTTTLTVASPGFVSAPTTGFGSQSVVVSQPALTLQSGVKVGSGLQFNMTGSLGVTQHGGVTVRVSSSDPTLLLISTSPTAPGSPFVDIFVANGASSYTFYAQGVAGMTGTATVTATNTAFTSGSTSVPIVPWQLSLVNLPATARAGATDTPFFVQALVSGGGAQTANPSGPLVVTLTSSNTSAATLTTSSQTAAASVTVTIPTGSSTSASSVAQGGVALHAVSAGTTNIAASAGGAQSASQEVTIQ